MTNRLAAETSLYLLQHADNPVDWHPWDETALAAARRSGKPILLSVGYSSCHWCHVMAHESFADLATAQVMNERFVNIKVDREERPDLDKVYQTAHQLLTRQSGGWPLTMFLEPETLAPFFGGTYFPKTPRHQLPSFIDLLLRVHQTFHKNRDALDQQNRRLIHFMQQLNPKAPSKGAALDDRTLLAKAQEELRAQYDPQEGGFGRAPKFPMPATLDRVLRHWAYSGRSSNKKDRAALDMLMTSLTKMARGGIYDHLGGGFCRYATDRAWMVPHFEKMLYDNGQLLSLYADTLAIGPDALFEGAVRETIGWLLREMRHPEGGFFSALDADSEGQEGKFHLWRRERVKRLLTDDEYLVMETLYGLDKPANFEGQWNLYRRDAWRSVVERLFLDPEQAAALLASAKAKLFQERAKRPRPGLDDKVLTSWNALAIKGLAKAAVVLDQPAWLEAAEAAMDFVRAQLWRDGELIATWKEGVAKHTAYLDDYANLLDALVTLLQIRWRDEDAIFARELADGALEHFMDEDTGGFFFTAHHHEKLISRPKPSSDGAQPPGNGVIALAFQRLGHLFGNAAYLDAADRTLAWARGMMESHPMGHCCLLTALEEQVHAPELVIMRGEDEGLHEWRQALVEGFRPWQQVYSIPFTARVIPPYLPRTSPFTGPRLVSTRGKPLPANRSPHAARLEPVDATIPPPRNPRTTAYICSHSSCSLPIDSLEELKSKLS